MGLVPEKDYEKLLLKEKQIEKEIKRLENTVIGGTEKVQLFLKEHNSAQLKNGVSLAELVKRPELDYELLEPLDENRPKLSFSVREQVNINIKYEGYIKRQQRQVEQFQKLEGKKLPEEIQYLQISGLRKEAAQKLDFYRPLSIGQASRISGVSPADISVLLVYLEQRKRQEQNEK